MKRSFLLLGSIISLLLFFYFYDQVFPVATLDLKVTQRQAELIARSFLLRLGFRLEGYENSVVFEGDGDGMVFLERSVGLARANELVKREVPIWRWVVRYFKPLEKESFKVRVNPSGRLDGFIHEIPDMAPGPDLTAKRAQPIARDFLLSRGVDLRDYTLVERSGLRKPRRMDHHFEWEKKNFSIPWKTNRGEERQGVLRIAVGVSGNRVDRWTPYLKVPEDFTRKLDGLGATGKLYTLVAIGLSLFLTFGSLAMFMVYFKKDRLRIPFAVGCGLAMVFLMVLERANRFPILKSSYESTTDLFTYFSTLLVSGLIGSLFIAMEVMLAGGAGEAMTRELYPGSLTSLDQWRGKGKKASVFEDSIWKGYALGFFILGFVTVYYFLGTRYFQVWLFPDPEYDNILGSYFPFLAPLSVSFVASLSEECVYRLFAVPFLKKTLHSLWLACLIPSMIWAFAHSSYPVYPSYVRGIELTTVGCLFCLGFLHWGFLSVVVAHYAIDAVLISLPLLRSESPYFFFSGIVVIALAALPLAVALIKSLARRRS